MAEPWVFCWDGFHHNSSKWISANRFMIVTFIRSKMKQYGQQLVHHTKY